MAEMAGGSNYFFSRMGFYFDFAHSNIPFLFILHEVYIPGGH
jgi:hypothetical protein